jgi:parvulin-like peptidyl-prolyl isomerase
MFRRLVVITAALLPIAFAADIKVVEEIAAKVNGDIITKGELDQQRKDIETQIRQEPGMTGAKLADAVNKYSADALRDQIDTLLLVQKGKDLNINVDGEVTRRMAEIQVQSKIDDPDKFHEYIRQQTGVPYEEFKKKITEQMLTRRVIGQEVGSRIAIPEPELKKYYDEHQKEFVREEQVFLSQILITTEGKTPEQVAAADKKAKDIVARARKGEKFSEIASSNSDDPETAKNGGYLGAYKRGMLRPEIENTVFKQKKGYVTDPITITAPQKAFLILKVDDHYEAGQASFDEVKDEIQGRLAEPKMEPKVRAFLTTLRQSAFLEIKDGYVDSGAAPGKDTRWHDALQLKPQTTTKEEVASKYHAHKKLAFIPLPFTKAKPKANTVDTSTLGEPKAPPAQPAQPAATPAKQ